MIVYGPVPISWQPASIVMSPFAARRTRAVDAKRKVDMIADAIPQPMSLSPSVIDRGFGERVAQPKRRAPSSYTSRSFLEENGLPESGSASA